MEDDTPQSEIELDNVGLIPDITPLSPTQKTMVDLLQKLFDDYDDNPSSSALSGARTATIVRVLQNHSSLRR